MTAGYGYALDLLEQGLAAQKEKKHGQAVELLGQFLKKNPKNPEAWKARAQSLSALDRRPEALQDLDKGLKFNPRNASLMLAKGKLLADLERRPEAIAAFSKLLALQPKNVEALKERAENYINEAELDKAMADLAKAKALAPTDPWVYHKTGMALFCLNRYNEAVDAFSAAIKISPETPLFYFSRGELYLRHLDSRDKAMADFDKGCSLGFPLCCHELEMLKAQQQPSEPGK
jgi:tetratricopeptide (TPR) repeat protein